MLLSPCLLPPSSLPLEAAVASFYLEKKLVSFLFKSLGVLLCEVYHHYHHMVKRLRRVMIDIVLIIVIVLGFLRVDGRASESRSVDVSRVFEAKLTMPLLGPSPWCDVAVAL